MAQAKTFASRMHAFGPAKKVFFQIWLSTRSSCTVVWSLSPVSRRATYASQPPIILWHAYYVHQYTYAVVVWMCDLSRRVLSTFSLFWFWWDEAPPEQVFLVSIDDFAVHLHLQIVLFPLFSFVPSNTASPSEQHCQLASTLVHPSLRLRCRRAWTLRCVQVVEVEKTLRRTRNTISDPTCPTNYLAIWQDGICKSQQTLFWSLHGRKKWLMLWRASVSDGMISPRSGELFFWNIDRESMPPSEDSKLLFRLQSESIIRSCSICFLINISYHNISNAT